MKCKTFIVVSCLLSLCLSVSAQIISQPPSEPSVERPPPPPPPKRKPRGAKFTCNNGNTILRRKFCDGVADCSDGSDEIYTDISCPECNLNEASCLHAVTNRRCIIDRDYVCNDTIKCVNATMCDIGCSSHYKCRNGTCVSRTTLCDRNKCNGCAEDDEWPTGTGFQCRRNNKRCRLPQQLLWDNVRDCDDGVDLCFTFNTTYTIGRNLSTVVMSTFNERNCLRCLDGSMIVPQEKVCDGVVDCSDLSDECLCSPLRANVCKHVRYHLPAKNRNSSNGSCLNGQVSCGGIKQTCVNRSDICDGKANCPNNRDEKYKFCRGTLPCEDGLPSDARQRCRCSKTECVRETGTLCDGFADCSPSSTNPQISWVEPPGYPSDECRAVCPSTPGFNCTIPESHGSSDKPPEMIKCVSYVLPLNAPQRPPRRPRKRSSVEMDASLIKCDGILNCTANWADERRCPERFRCHSKKLVSIERSKVCDGYEDCDKGRDEGNCPGRFKCKSLSNNKMSISKRSVCDLRINCDNADDEKNCTNDGRFYCESGIPLFVPEKKKFDGRADCTDWSDECPTINASSNENILASRYELIGNSFLRVLLWIMGLLATVGNLIVIVGQCITLKSIKVKHGAASLRSNHLLVLNLACSDFLMGVYLISLGVAGAMYRGVYCIESMSWLAGHACTAMGVLVVISSETSTMTMVILTACRLYAIVKPFSTSHQPRKKTVLLMILFTWCFSTAIAFIPLADSLQHFFVEKALVESNPYISGVVVHFKAAKEFTMKLFTFVPELSMLPDSVATEVQTFTAWRELERFFATYAPTLNLLKVSKYFGYYSANSACIPRIFITRKVQAWPFSLAIAIFNFLAFMFVAAAYIALLIKAKPRNARVVPEEVENQQNQAMQRKVARLIITDFCCWVPLCAMVFINFSGVSVSNIAYAVVAIVLLPINSALNPILYSTIIDKLISKIHEKRQMQSPGRNTTSRATLPTVSMKMEKPSEK